MGAVAEGVTTALIAALIWYWIARLTFFRKRRAAANVIAIFGAWAIVWTSRASPDMVLGAIVGAISATAVCGWLYWKHRLD